MRKKILILLILPILLSTCLQVKAEENLEDKNLEDKIKWIVLNDEKIKDLIKDKYVIIETGILIRRDITPDGVEKSISAHSKIWFPEQKSAYLVRTDLDKGVVKDIKSISYFAPNLEIAKPISYKRTIEELEVWIKEIVLDDKRADRFRERTHYKTELRLVFYSKITPESIGETKVHSVPTLRVSFDNKRYLFIVDLKEERVINFKSEGILGAWATKQSKEVLPTGVLSTDLMWIPFGIVSILAIIGILGVIFKRKIKWAGLAAAWGFYLPVILGILAPMIVPFLGIGVIYLTWKPLYMHPKLSFLSLGMYPYPYSPMPIIIRRAMPILGIILIVLGLGITIVGFWQIVHARRRESGLVKGGLYSISRHPQYFAIILWTLGIVLLHPIPRIIDFLLWTVLVLLHIFLADSEEVKLCKEFGIEYEKYRKKVPFILPFSKKFDNIFRFVPRSGWGRKAVEMAIYIPLVSLFIYFLSFYATCSTATYPY